MYELIRELEKTKNEWRILKNQWGNTSQLWNDNVRIQFENQFWSEIEKLIIAYQRKLEETSELVSKTYRDLDL